MIILSLRSPSSDREGGRERGEEGGVGGRGEGGGDPPHDAISKSADSTRQGWLEGGRERGTHTHRQGGGVGGGERVVVARCDIIAHA